MQLVDYELVEEEVVYSHVTASSLCQWHVLDILNFPIMAELLPRSLLLLHYLPTPKRNDNRSFENE
jgi:hypothetical protein